MSAAQQNTVLPRPMAFKVVVMGLLAFVVLTAAIQIVATGDGPDLRPSWQAPMEWLFGGVFISCLMLLWIRQGWAFYVFCASMLMKIAIMFMIVQMAALPSIVMHLIILGLVFWGLHAGGNASMWQQMFGGTAQGSPGAYGFRPAPPPTMPPAAPASPNPSPLAPPPAAMASPPPTRPAAPPPAPARSVAPAMASPAAADPYEQIRKLAGLRDAGLLTAAEFDAKKTELLKRL